MMIRFVICIVFNWFIINCLYYSKSRRRDFYFTFLLTSVAIFFLVFFMIFGLDDLGGKTSMGIGIGLFGIFSIMRYRTDAMPAREMTFLFVVVSLSVVNAIASRVSYAEILATNTIVVLAIWLCEKILKENPKKLVQYDRIELIVPERREELIADLEKRIGVKVIDVEVGAIDFLKDMAMLRITYEGKPNTTDKTLKLRREDLTTF
jgi:Ca2+/Na+ antiporter